MVIKAPAAPSYLDRLPPVPVSRPGDRDRPLQASLPPKKAKPVRQASLPKSSTGTVRALIGRKGSIDSRMNKSGSDYSLKGGKKNPSPKNKPLAPLPPQTTRPFGLQEKGNKQAEIDDFFKKNYGLSK